jgi:hypothetical protein
MSSTNCIFSALLNVSSLRRASSSTLVLTVYETVASLLLVKVFKSWVYSLRRRLKDCHASGFSFGGGGLPIGNVIVLPVHASDELLDGVSAVVQHEDDRGQLVSDHRRQFLGGELPETKFQCVI